MQENVKKLTFLLAAAILAILAFSNPSRGEGEYWYAACPGGGACIIVEGANGGMEAALRSYRLWYPQLASLQPYCWVLTSPHPNAGKHWTCETYGHNFTCALNWAGLLPCHASAKLACHEGYEDVGNGRCARPKLIARCDAGIGSPTTTKPIEISTGRKLGSYVDWTASGQRELRFERHYSSTDNMTYGSAYSLLGPNWRSNFDSRATYSLSPSSANPGTATFNSAMYFVLPSGQEYAFRKVISGEWKPVAPNMNGPLSQYTVRTDLDISLAVTVDTVELKLPDNTKYVYDFGGLLVRIVFADGYAHHLAYSNTYLSSVIDSLGRVMKFETEPGPARTGYLKSVLTPDGKRIKFTYADRFVPTPGAVLPAGYEQTSNFALGSVIMPDATPLTETDNPRKTFEYWNNPLFPYALTGIFDENGNRYLTVTYQADGRAASSELNGGAEKSTISYDDANDKVTVTNALGRSTVYSFETQLGSVRRLKAVDGITTTNCAASNTSYTYGANGYVSEATDAEGRVIAWQKDSRGLPVSTTRGAGTPSAVTTTTAWHPSLPLPVVISEPGRTTTYAYNTAGLVLNASQTDTTTTTVPYATTNQVRATAFTYQSFIQPNPPTVGPTGTALADLPVAVINPNAGTGTMAGWTNALGSMTVGTSNVCSAANPCFFGQTNSTLPWITQQDVVIPVATLSDIDTGRRAARLTWKQSTWSGNGGGTVRALFLGQTGSILGSATYGMTVGETSFVARELVRPVPPLTRTIRLQMIVGGTAATFFDDFGLVLIANGSATASPYLSIVNPDGLNGMSGWATATGLVVIPQTSPCPPALYSCFADGDLLSDKAYQDIALPADRYGEIDSNARSIEVTWSARSDAQSTSGNVELQFLDSTNQPIPNATIASPAVFGNATWEIRKLSADVPPGSRKARLTFNFNHAISGAPGAYAMGFTARLVGRVVPTTPVLLLSASDGPLAGTGDSVTYQYGTNGFLNQVTNEMGHVTQIASINSRGQPTSVIDPNGITTNLAYNDERGWLTSITVNPGTSQAVTTLSYDAVGQITRIARPDATYLDYTWNAARQLTSIMNSSGERIEYSYNLNGDVTSSAIKSPAGVVKKQMAMVYDELGRLLRSIGAANQTTVFAYDRTNLNTLVTDPRNNLYSYAYDALSRLIRETNQENAAVNLTRNGQDDVVAHADPRLITTTYVRNGFGEVIQETSPDAGTTVYVRDARGLVTQKTDGRGIVSNRTFDNAGRQLTQTYPAAVTENITYTYDSVLNGNKGKGRLTKVQDQSGSTEFVHDVFGRVTSDKRTIAGKIYTTAYGYTTSGRLASMTYPSGRTLAITRNANGQVTRVSSKQNATATAATVATSITYAPLSDLVKTITHGNGLVTSAGYDLDYRLASLAVKDGAVNVQAFAYAYGDNLNLTGITDQVTAANSNTLTYSPANRLASASGAWGTNSFTHDSVGNRLSDTTTLAARLSAYATTSNRMTGMSSNGGAFRTYTYDGAGNIITDVRPTESFAYTYNKRNRLASVTRNGAAYATYVYNALEQLASRNTVAAGGPVGTVHYVYDRDGHLIAEADAATGATTREYIWLPANDTSNDTLAEAMGLAEDNDNVPDLPLAVINVSATPITYMVHTDHLGRPTRMTDASRATVWAATYKPWGEVHSLSGTQSNNLRFPGQYFQIETGLAYNWHRHYDPVTGRYTQPDPLGFVDGPSVYAYAGNSPFMNVDRDGRAVIVIPFIPQIVGGLKFAFDIVVGGTVLITTMIMTSDPTGVQPQTDDRTLPFPDVVRRNWSCICRADCNDNIPGNCPEDPLRRFAFGQGVAPSFNQAVTQGKRNATQNLSCQPKHIPCNCTGPNGERRRAQ